MNVPMALYQQATLVERIIMNSLNIDIQEGIYLLSCLEDLEYISDCIVKDSASDSLKGYLGILCCNIEYNIMCIRIGYPKGCENLHGNPWSCSSKNFYEELGCEILAVPRNEYRVELL